MENAEHSTWIDLKKTELNKRQAQGHRLPIQEQAKLTHFRINYNHGCLWGLRGPFLVNSLRHTYKIQDL